MSATSQPDHPDELKLPYWEKKKGSLPSGHEVGDKLKALQKKHDAVDWKLFDIGWPKAAKTAADLEQAFALRDRLYRGSVFALKKDALGVASAAKAMEKEKGAAKPMLDAAKAIGKAANGYADAVDEGIDTLKSLYDKALAALPKEAPGKGDDGDGEDEPGSALLDPKRLVAQLKQCQRTPDRTVNFAFVDSVGKEQPAVAAMHPKMTSTSLFNKLKKETGSKTGAYGSAWVDGTSLMLQLDKPLGGLVKKMRAVVKAAGFRVAKVVLWSEDGTVFEQDDEPDKDADAPGAEAKADAPGAPGSPAGPAAKSIPPAPPGGPAAKTPAAKAATPTPPTASPESTAFMARLKALLETAAKAGDAALAQQAKLLGSEAGVFLRKGDAAKVDELMTRAEALFAKGKSAPGTKPAESNTAADTGTKATTALSEEELDVAWLTRFGATEKVYLEVMARQPADAGKLRALMDFANGKAEAKQYASASQALDRLDAMLAKVPAAPKAQGGATTDADRAKTAGEANGEKGYKGLVAYRTSLLEFRKAVATVNSQIASLKAAIPSQMPEESDLADELSSELSALTKSLLDAVDEAMNTAENVDSPIVDAMADRLVAYADELQSSELVEHVDNNPFGVSMSVQKTLMDALSSIQRNWPVPA
jgi:hypothetical protein